jgi:hypothetical protein
MTYKEYYGLESLIMIFSNLLISYERRNVYKGIKDCLRNIIYCGIAAMAARSIWKGAMSFGLVNIPVQVFSAEQKEEHTSFNQLCEKGHKIKYKKWCPVEEREVPWFAAEGAKTTSSTQLESQAILPREYIKDTLTFRYRECKSCGTRTELTCIKCGFCYSCRWKKEEVEKQLFDNKYHKTYSSPLIPTRKIKLTYKEKKEQPQERKQRQQQMRSVLGQLSEPICTYYRCHNFSLHSSSKCRSRHPTNKTLGISVRYLWNMRT